MGDAFNYASDPQTSLPAVSRAARMLAVTESMTATLYVAVLIARLVALYSTTDLTIKEKTPKS